MGTKNIPRMKVGRQQHTYGRTVRQFFEEPQTLTDQAGITPRERQRLGCGQLIAGFG